MPTVFETKGYRFFFYSNENNEPIHIHVGKGDAECKFWITPQIKVEYSYGFKSQEKKQIVQLIETHVDNIVKKWNEFFK